MRSLTFLAFVLALATSTLQDTVKVSIYYESLCPYVLTFMNEQLAPVYDALGGEQHIKLDLVPYGNTNNTWNEDHWDFECIHGEPECFSQKVHGCALNENLPPAKVYAFIRCTFASDDVAAPTTQRKCCDENDIDWLPLHECYLSGKGDAMLAAYGLLTERLKRENHIVGKLPRMPTVVFNDQYDRELVDAALDDLHAALCGLYQDPKPVGCQ